MTPAELFDRAGRALYGDHYVAPLAHALGVGKVTARNWAAGKSSVPAAVWAELERMALQRGEELDAVADAIVALADAGHKKSPPAG